MTDRSRARELARTAVAAGDVTGWFETLYAEARAGSAVVPWGDLAPNPHVVAWLDRNPAWAGAALDIGTGFGDTAAELARRGFAVTAFDVSATAVAEAARRFPASGIEWRVHDLLALPAALDARFALVVECYTLQVLPPDARARAVASLRRLVAPGGTLLVVARGREPHEPEGAMPWPLTRAEIEAIAQPPLALRELEDFMDEAAPPVRRLRATFERHDA